MTATAHDRRTAILFATAFALMAALTAIDLRTDLRQGTTSIHAVIEALVIAVGLVAAGLLATRARRLAHELRDQAAELATDLDASRAEAARWRGEARDLISGLSAAIDAQLERWNLTAAEKDIALLLLKGLSHKEIAAVRGVGETTVRQQARAIYRKSGLSGRSDLAAFFLEDLLGPGRV